MCSFFTFKHQPLSSARFQGQPRLALLVNTLEMAFQDIVHLLLAGYPGSRSVLGGRAGAAGHLSVGHVGVEEGATEWWSSRSV